MPIIAQPSNYWISPNALSISLNALGEPDRIQCSIASGSVVSCYIESVKPASAGEGYEKNGDGLGLDNGRNPKRWPLTVAPTYFNSHTEKYVYVAIPRSSAVGTQAMVVFPSELIDIYGYTIVTAVVKDGEGHMLDADGNVTDDLTHAATEQVQGEQIGTDDFFYIWLQGIITSSGDNGQTDRDWGQRIDTGSLGTYEDLVTLSDEWYEYSRIDQMVTFLKEIAMGVNSVFRNLKAKLLILGGHTFKGAAITSVTPEDSEDTIVTPAYLKSVTADRYLRKDRDDSTPFSLTIGGGVRTNEIRSINPPYTGAGILDTGFLLTADDGTGKSKLIIDNAYFRGKVVMEALEIRKIYHTGGNEIKSPAAQTNTRVDYYFGINASTGEPEDLRGYTMMKVPWLLRGLRLLGLGRKDGALTRKIWSKYKRVYVGITPEQMTEVKVFRCYAKADDGTMQTRGDWMAYDQAFCQTLNLVEGKTDSSGSYSGRLSNKRYWYLVKGIGSARLEDGKFYDYVDLLAGDCQEGSDYPEAGDDMVCLGNRVDPERQSAIIFEVIGDDAPAIKEYANINNFDLTGKRLSMISPKAGDEFFARRFTVMTGSQLTPIPVDRGDWSEDVVRQRQGYYYYDRVSYTDESTGVGGIWLCVYNPNRTKYYYKKNVTVCSLEQYRNKTDEEKAAYRIDTRIDKAAYDELSDENKATYEEYEDFTDVVPSLSAPAHWLLQVSNGLRGTHGSQVTIGEVDGKKYWFIDGVNTGVVAEGKDGQGVNLQGHVDVLYDRDKTVQTQTALESVGMTQTLSFGDYWVVNSNRRLYMYLNNGQTFPDNWEDLGEFKGDPGESSYIHVAYADDVETDADGNVTVISTNGTTNHFLVDYDGQSHAWMGIATDHEATDPGRDLHLPIVGPSAQQIQDIKAAASQYKWNFVKGKDGNGYEYVYLRTKSNTKPGLSEDTYTENSVTYSKSQDEFLPKVPNPTSDYESGKWTDDPKGVTAEWRYEWQAVRKKTGGTWGSFAVSSAPVHIFYRPPFWSRVYRRSESDLSATPPTGGSYDSPLPTDKDADDNLLWHDGIPQTGSGMVWTSIRKFADGETTAWSAPVIDRDTNDTDIEYAFGQPGDVQPADPADDAPPLSGSGTPQLGNRHGGSGTQIWFDPVLDSASLPDGKTWSDMVWRAERQVKNGVPSGPWVVTRIKGEKGDPGGKAEHMESWFLALGGNARPSVPAVNTGVNPPTSTVDGQIKTWSKDQAANWGETDKYLFRMDKYSVQGGDTFWTEPYFSSEWADQGPAGQDAIRIDLDRQTDDISCDAGNRVRFTRIITVRARIYVGGTALTEGFSRALQWDYQVIKDGNTNRCVPTINGQSTSNATSTSPQDGCFTFQWELQAGTVLSAASYDIPIALRYGDETYTANYTLVRKNDSAVSIRLNPSVMIFQEISANNSDTVNIIGRNSASESGTGFNNEASVVIEDAGGPTTAYSYRITGVTPSRPDHASGQSCTAEVLNDSNGQIMHIKAIGTYTYTRQYDGETISTGTAFYEEGYVDVAVRVTPPEGQAYDVTLRLQFRVNTQGSFYLDVLGDTQTAIARKITYGYDHDTEDNLTSLQNIGKYIKSSEKNISKIQGDMYENGQLVLASKSEVEQTANRISLSVTESKGMKGRNYLTGSGFFDFAITSRPFGISPEFYDALKNLAPTPEKKVYVGVSVYYFIPDSDELGYTSQFGSNGATGNGMRIGMEPRWSHRSETDASALNLSCWAVNGQSTGGIIVGGLQRIKKVYGLTAVPPKDCEDQLHYYNQLYQATALADRVLVGYGKLEILAPDADSIPSGNDLTALTSLITDWSEAPEDKMDKRLVFRQSFSTPVVLQTGSSQLSYTAAGLRSLASGSLVLFYIDAQRTGGNIYLKIGNGSDSWVYAFSNSSISSAQAGAAKVFSQASPDDGSYTRFWFVKRMYKWTGTATNTTTYRKYGIVPEINESAVTLGVGSGSYFKIKSFGMYVVGYDYRSALKRSGIDIDAERIVLDSETTVCTGDFFVPRVISENNEMRTVIQAGYLKIESKVQNSNSYGLFMINSDGEVVLQMYDKNGNVVASLGGTPSSMKNGGWKLIELRKIADAGTPSSQLLATSDNLTANHYGAASKPCGKYYELVLGVVSNEESGLMYFIPASSRGGLNEQTYNSEVIARNGCVYGSGTGSSFTGANQAAVEAYITTAANCIPDGWYVARNDGIFRQAISMTDDGTQTEGMIVWECTIYKYVSGQVVATVDKQFTN